MRPRFDGLVSTRACPQVQPRELPQGKKELAELRRELVAKCMEKGDFYTVTNADEQLMCVQLLHFHSARRSKCTLAKSWTSAVRLPCCCTMSGAKRKPQQGSSLAR